MGTWRCSESIYQGPDLIFKGADEDGIPEDATMLSALLAKPGQKLPAVDTVQNT